ncbi:MAG: hypothetical protein ACYDHY_19745 [Acidiferrobacterales bacterium]
MSWGGHGNTWGSQGGNGSCRGSENGSMGVDCFSFRKTLLPQTKAYLKQCNPKPSAKWTKALNAFIKGLIADGNWALLDRMWLFNTDYQQNARISIVNPSSAQITEVNSPTWTKNVGYTGNGTNSYLNTNYNPYTQGVNYTLNNAAFGLYALTQNTVLYGEEIGSPYNYIQVGLNFRNDNYSLCDVNNLDMANSVIIASYPVLQASVRSNSTSYYQTINGITQISAAVSSVAVTNYNMTILQGANGLTNNTIGMAFFGSGSINQAKLYSRFSTFLTNL